MSQGLTDMEDKHRHLKQESKHKISANLWSTVPRIQGIGGLLLVLLLMNLCISCGQMGGDIGFGPPEREVEKIYRPAETMYNGLLEGEIRSSQRNWNNVIRQFKKVVKDHPKSRFADDAQYKLGASYVRAHGLIEDSPRKAIRAFEQLIKRYPDSEFVDDAYYWKAYAHFLCEDYERAIAEYEEFTRGYPQSELHREAFHQIEECRTRIDGQEKDQAEISSLAKGDSSGSPPTAVSPGRCE